MSGPTHDDEWDGDWAHGTLRCRICGHEHVGVWPAGGPMEECQECPECGHPTAEPVEADGDEFDDEDEDGDPLMPV